MPDGTTRLHEDGSADFMRCRLFVCFQSIFRFSPDSPVSFSFPIKQKYYGVTKLI